MNNYNLVFFGSSTDKEKMEGDYILISHKNGFNDFSFETQALFTVFNKGNKVFSGGIYFAFKNFISNEYFAFEKTDVNDSVYSQLYFFSMLKDYQAYRTLIRLLGVDEALRVLGSMNDIILMKKNNKNDKSGTEDPLGNRKSYDDFIKSDIFNLSFVRRSDAFFAFNNAEDIFSGLNFERLDYISTNLELTNPLGKKGGGNQVPLLLKYKLDDIFPKRMNLIIGENGVGKTTILRNLIKILIGSNLPGSKLIDVVTNDRPQINRFLYIDFVGLNSYKINNSRGVIINSARKDFLNYKKLLVDLLKLPSFIADSSRWRIFNDALRHQLPVENIKLISSRTDFSISLLDLQGNSELNFLNLIKALPYDIKPILVNHGEKCELSAGQKIFFDFALFACSSIENGTLIFIDEPETNLHPSFISGLMELLDFILESTGSLALIATHSPYVVREVSREQVHILRRLSNGTVDISTARLKTFGANISDISEFIFNDNIKNKLCDKVVNSAKRRGLSYNEVKEHYRNEMSIEMFHYIGSFLNKD